MVTALRSKRVIAAMGLMILAVLVLWRMTQPLGAQQQQPRFSVQTLVNPVRYPTIGARLEPLPKQATGTSLISADRAFDTYATAASKSGQEQSTKLPVMQLVSYSNDILGSETDTGEPRVPRTQNVPAWVIIFPDAPMVLHGPGPGQGADLTPKFQARCPLVYVVNAETGSYIEAFQTCAQPEVG